VCGKKFGWFLLVEVTALVLAALVLLCKRLGRGPAGSPAGGAGLPAMAVRVGAGSPRPVPRARPLPRLRAPRLVVVKSAGVLEAYDGRRLVKTYPVSIGSASGDKLREGDLRTPEGRFYVCVRKAAPKTPYVRSMGLSYPDAEDAARGLREGRISREQHDRIVAAIRRRTVPPWDTPLGGAIMIHGCRNGGRGTKGCIALEDDDVRELYAEVPLGTPVIVRP
jgi:hypothetical protein